MLNTESKSHMILFIISSTANSFEQVLDDGFSDCLRLSIKAKNKLFYRYKKVHSVKNEVNYKTCKSQQQKLLKTAEKQHYQELLTRYKDNMKKSWGIRKNIINKNKSLGYQTKFKLRDGTVTTDKTAISKHFNEFFLNVGPNLAKAIPKINIDPKSYLGESMKATIFWNLLLWMRSKRLYCH